ncbi:two component transcriptional regulator, LuxR family [Chthoniobacter flavus Ellin428]|uniref:Two component transcriptional regulator, LuxR family n=1 Tax=Chthoniobacter flavus Ellin428 TaxID=497964 RepID=B4CVL8_9BACT|nr:response regulator transcription factor [Chthoniobacter flavus]EDY21460.1 two component transcriptional regulator, LuxR family [Chthoniobacter flavus Ellin428]TCO95415.1 LuxR family two component transcriptional regulator [Chthoniobacter flavus]
METTKVLIADDHQVMRRGVRAVVELLEGWEVCGEASTGREAVEMVEKLQPQIVVMDVTMPELNGLEATRQIKKIAPATEILMFTGLETEELIRQVFEAGARSYILKTDGREQLEAALTALAAHKPYFTTQVGEILFAKFLHGKPKDEEQTVDGRLTDREREIVQLLAEGASNKEVADSLGISVKTVETHRAAIMKKLKFKSFSDLVRYAIRNHIISA